MGRGMVVARPLGPLAVAVGGCGSGVSSTPRRSMRRYRRSAAGSSSARGFAPMTSGSRVRRSCPAAAARSRVAARASCRNRSQGRRPTLRRFTRLTSPLRGTPTQLESSLGPRRRPDAGRPTQGVRGQAAQGAGVGRESALLTAGGRLGQEPRRGRPAVEAGRLPIRDGVEQRLGD